MASEGLYSDRLSAAPGEVVRLFASLQSDRADLAIDRVGAARTRVLEARGLSMGPQTTRPEPDANGCGWSERFSFVVPEDWRSGYYDLVLSPTTGEPVHHMLCVKTPPDRAARAVVVLATNTLAAYNYWGGRSAYADVEALMSRRTDLAAAMAGALGVLSSERPFAPALLAQPPEAPRLVNLTPRGFGARPWAGADPAWSKANNRSPYDGSAGFLNKWEHRFAAWAEAQGVEVDYLTDFDLEAGPQVLEPYACVILVGHSEYWSGPQRDALEAFVDQGGRLAIFSGNTAFWKVRWEDAGRRLVCRKWRGLEADPLAAHAPQAATHLWSHPAFARPEAQITGLSFLFGGYHRLGLCAARGAGGYTVYRDQHWALEGCDLYYGDVFGAQTPLLGYENDGCRFTFDDDNLPRAVPHLGVPPDLEIIALAPAAFGEAPSPYRPLIPPEELQTVAEIGYGSSSSAAQARVLRGHAVMASFQRGRGEVFNAGTTEWAYGLGADPFVDRITLNVLRRFGAL